MQETLAAGGPIVWILVVMSAASLALIAAKTMALGGATAGAAGREIAFDLWRRGDREGAIAALQGRSPIDRLLAQAMLGIVSGHHRAGLDSDLQWRGNAEVSEMSRHIRLLELVAMVAPLLGLLGTVLGMIQSFRELALAEGAANASLLAAGIWQALLTTAAGLIVAIPAAVAAGLLAARVERASQAIEAAVGRLYAIEDQMG